MKKFKLMLCGLFLAATAGAIFAMDGYYFYSPKDYENVKASVQTPRGKEILASIVAGIEERRTHPFVLPKEKPGRGHWYVCSTHSVPLKFDWNKPNEHWCEVCKKYLTSKSLYAGWVKTLHQKNAQYMTGCMWAYMATGDVKYANYIRDMLLDYAKLYPKFEEPSLEAVAKDYHLSRMFDQWLDDCIWITSIAPAYVAAKEVMTDSQKNEIIENLFKLLADQQMNRSGNNNWQVWNNCGRIYLGIVLENDDIIDIALNEKKGLVRALQTEVNEDGWYNEASVGYHYFPLNAFLGAANAVRSRGINMFDEKFEKMFTSVIDASYPDLSVVAHNDCWYGISISNQAPMYELAYARMHTEFMRNILSQFYSKEKRLSPESLLNPDEIAPAAAPLKLGSKLFPQTGFAVLRDGKNTATLTFGESHGGHGHPHRLSITLHDGSREILPDFGTPGYGSPLYRAWYQKTFAHNTVSVDGADHKIMRTPGELVRFKPFAGGGGVVAKADKAYNGVKMARSIELKNGKFADSFSASSETEHVYDYILHLRDKPEFDAVLSDAAWAEYPPLKFISAQKSFKTDKPFKLKTATAEIVINPNAEAEVLTGVAPGPVFAEAKDESDVSVYPVIVRVRGKNLDVSAEWAIK